MPHPGPVFLWFLCFFCLHLFTRCVNSSQDKTQRHGRNCPGNNGFVPFVEETSVHIHRSYACGLRAGAHLSYLLKPFQTRVDARYSADGLDKVVAPGTPHNMGALARYDHLDFCSPPWEGHSTASNGKSPDDCPRFKTFGLLLSRS